MSRTAVLLEEPGNSANQSYFEAFFVVPTDDKRTAVIQEMAVLYPLVRLDSEALVCTNRTEKGFGKSAAQD